MLVHVMKLKYSIEPDEEVKSIGQQLALWKSKYTIP